MSKLRLMLGILVSLISTFGQAATPISFAYQGKLTDNNGVALNSTVHFKLQIYDPTATCLLYEETQSNIALSNGLFNIQVGSALSSSKRSSNDPGLSMETVYSNSNGSIRSAGTANCSLGYTPQDTDKRRMKVTVTDVASNTVTVLSPMQDITMNPYSMVANIAGDATKLQGKSASEFIQTDTTSVTQNNVKALTDKVTDLLAMLAANVSNKFQSIMTDYQGSGRLTVADSPTTSTDAINRNYADSKIAGKDVASNLKSAGASEDGKVIAWSQAQNKYILQAAPSGAGSITSSDVTTALGYTPQQQNSELSGLASILATGLVQRTGTGTYSGIGVSAPMTTVGNNLGLSIGAGLTTASGSLVADFGTTANKVAAGNDTRIVNAVQSSDARLPAATCASGSFNRWTGSAWVCEVDSSGGGGSGQFSTSGNDLYYTTGKVGIGTATPSSTLSVNGSMGISESVAEPATTPGYGVIWAKPALGDGVDANSKFVGHFDTGIQDSSANGVVFTNTGGVTISSTEKKFGVAAAAFTTTSYLSSADANVTTFTGDFTLELNVYFNNFAGTPYLIGNQGAYQVNIDGSRPYLWKNGIGNVITSSTVLAANTWYHLAVVRSGSTITMYLNGVSVGTTASSGTLSFGTMLIGTPSSAIGNPTYGLNGYIDEVRISNSARYLSNFTSPVAAFDSGGTLYYKDSQGNSTPIAGLANSIPSPTSLNGSVVLASTFDLTGANQSYQNTGLSITLPAAGTYHITGNVRGHIEGTSTGNYISAQLYNNTDSAVVANSETFVLYTDDSTALQATAPINSIVTVNGAKTLYLYAFRNCAGTCTTSKIVSDSFGKTKLSWVKLAN